MSRQTGGGVCSKPDIAFTLDLEDHLGLYNEDSRFSAITYRILDFLDELNVTGTVFGVGRLVETDPALIRAIADRGHELGCHSYRHRPLDKEQIPDFVTETRRAKDALEQCSSHVVTGYRAPVFSLVRSTIWAVEKLKDMGFVYSSSVMPAHNPLYGFPEAPRRPFLWPNGLIELPCAVACIGPLTLPYLGGIYLRYVPAVMVENLARRAKPDDLLWTYCHPYDFDADESYARMPDTNFATNMLLWLNRQRTFSKMRRLLTQSRSRPLCDIIADPAFTATLTTFEFGWPAQS